MVGVFFVPLLLLFAACNLLVVHACTGGNWGLTILLTGAVVALAVSEAKKREAKKTKDG